MRILLFKGESPSLFHSPGPLAIETSDRLWSSAVHGRTDKDRPWKDEASSFNAIIYFLNGEIELSGQG